MSADDRFSVDPAPNWGGQAAEDARRQAHKMEALGQLASGVAHDFNNLLTVICGYAEMLQARAAGQESLVEYAAQIRLAAERAADLTRQLLAFSRRSVLTPVVLDPNLLLRETRGLLQRLLGEDVRLQLGLEDGVPRVRVDRGHLTQVLVNLAVNGRDAMPRGGALLLSTRAASPGGTAHPAGTVISVCDTGEGMSDEVRARMFEPFFTTKEAGRGTGLGLAVVQGIVDQSGGLLRVESALGQGTTVEVWFPAAREEEETERPAVPAPVAAEGKSVFLVEDEEAVLGVLELALRGAGYHVRSARSAEDALELARGMERPPELLITDVVMPGRNGCELAEELRAQWPDLRVLFVSGYTDEAIDRRGPRIGGSELLPKPFTPQALLERVRSLLGC